jgi:hypothetical protein
LIKPTLKLLPVAAKLLEANKRQMAEEMISIGPGLSDADGAQVVDIDEFVQQRDFLLLKAYAALTAAVATIFSL